MKKNGLPLTAKMEKKSPENNSIFTVGYSTHSIDKFIDLLKAHDIQKVVDIRSIPKSRYQPDFNKDELALALKKAKIGYTHLKELGGLRSTSKNSVNTAWENASFRGFADYMQTEGFQKGLEKLEKIARKKRCAIMCAEGVFWRCHRSLVADALKKRKWKVRHIQSRKTAKPHTLTPFLKVKKGQITYPAAPTVQH